MREYSSQGGTGSADVKPGAAGSAGGAGGQAIMPQLDQSFLDRIMALSTAQADEEYRRRLTDRLVEESVKMAARNREAAYYDDLVKELRSPAGRTSDYSQVPAPGSSA